MKVRNLVLFVPVLALLASACGDDEDDSFDASLYAGTYAGTWTNTGNGTTGPATIAITVDEKAKTASLTLDFGGNYLGLGDPPAVTIAGVFDDERATVKGSDDLFGNYNVTIEKDGKITGLMENMAGGLIPKLSYTGTLTKSTLDADYQVTFNDNSTANSVLKMTK